jgi:hypothetical protein
MEQAKIVLFDGTSIDVGAFVSDIAKATPSLSFDAKVVHTIQEFSKFLMRDDVLRLDPAWIALGYWFRRSALTRLQDHFLSKCPENTIAAPRGVALHLPPQNVDTLFIYSWALSALAGNINIVRLPSNLSPTVQRVVKQLILFLAEAGLEERNYFISYPHISDVTQELSLISDVRMVWGGDEKIRMISTIPAKPRCLTLNFADRFSLSIIKASYFMRIDSDAQAKLAQLAYNDIYLFDQKACSSSRLYIWVGEEGECEKASTLFYKLIVQQARSKRYDIAPHTALNKFSARNRAALDYAVQDSYTEDAWFTSVQLKKLEDIRDENPGGGFVFSYFTNDATNIADFISTKDQTLTHFGFEVHEKRRLAETLICKGIDRIVPIGEALNFDSVWDGYDLLTSVSKMVRVL